MPTYSLDIQIDNAGLGTLSTAGQSVTIVKAVPSSQLPVIWVAFTPMEDSLVTWTENYSVYASNTQVQAGATIHTLSTQQASGGQTYTFDQGHFDNGQPTPGLPANQYGVTNSDPNFNLLTSGLVQVPNVNGNPQGLNPLNANVVLYTQSAQFTPIEKVYVFTQAHHNNGLVISTVSGVALLVDLTQAQSQTIHYNDATNRFVMGALP